MLAQLMTFIQMHPVMVSLTLVVLLTAVLLEIRKGGRPLTVAEVTRMINDNKAAIIDIRPEKEFKTGHISESVNIPADQLLKQKALLSRHADRTLILVCSTGMACRSSVERLEEEGIKAQRLVGGINEWVAAKIPLAR